MIGMKGTLDTVLVKAPHRKEVFTEQELEDWIDQRETQMTINSYVGYVRSEDVRLLMSKIREKLSASAQESGG